MNDMERPELARKEIYDNSGGRQALRTAAKLLQKQTAA